MGKKSYEKKKKENCGWLIHGQNNLQCGSDFMLICESLAAQLQLDTTKH